MRFCTHGDFDFSLPRTTPRNNDNPPACLALQTYKIHKYGDSVTKAGLDYIQHPIVEMAAPEDLEATYALVSTAISVLPTRLRWKASSTLHNSTTVTVLPCRDCSDFAISNAKMLGLRTCRLQTCSIVFQEEKSLQFIVVEVLGGQA